MGGVAIVSARSESVLITTPGRPKKNGLLYFGGGLRCGKLLILYLEALALFSPPAYQYFNGQSISINEETRRTGHYFAVRL